MAIKITKKDYFWSYAANFLNLAINIILLPLILKNVNTTELGLWYTFSSIGTMVTMFDFGFSKTLLRNITYAWCGAEKICKEGTDDTSKHGDKPNLLLFVKLFHASRLVCMCVAGVAFLIMISIGMIYVKYIVQGTNYNVELPWLIYSVAVFLNLYYNNWTTVLNGVGAVRYAQKAIVYSKIIQIVVTIVCLKMGMGLVGLTIAYLLAGITLRLVAMYYLNRYEGIGQAFTDYGKAYEKRELLEIFKIIWFNAKKAGISTLASTAMTQSNTLICSGIIGVDFTASFGLCFQIANVISGISQIYFQTRLPELTSARVLGQKDKVKRIFSAGLLVYWFCMVGGSLCVVFLGETITTILNSDTKISVVLMAGISFNLLCETTQALSNAYTATSNKLPFVKSIVITAICMILLSLFNTVILELGVMGLIISQAVAEWMYINWKWVKYALDDLNLTIKELFSLGFEEVMLLMKKIIVRK